MLDAAWSAAGKLFDVGPIVGMIIMTPIALISGLMPAGNLPVAAILLGFVGFLDPWVAVTLIVFYMAASDITEPVPAIMLGIPGSRSAQATVLDGYPMARQGLAGIALGASYTTTLVGGIFGALALLISLPLARELIRLFGSAEFLLLSLMGIMAVAVVSSGAIVKGLLAGGLGLAISMMGYSLIGGVVRADFWGVEYLWDGIPLIPIVIGLFALPEAIDLVVGNQPIATERMGEMLRQAQKDVLKGMRVAMNHKWLMIRSSLIGTFIGALPGLGASTGHWIAYARARQTEKGAAETFGKGDVRGIIASDAANNSSDGGVLIPTVAFGIPGSSGMAILMTMLVLYGITPGPAMLNQHLDLTVSLVFTIIIANVIVVPIMLGFSPLITKVAAVPPNLLAPAIIAMVTIGAFQTSASMGDLVVTAVFAVLGVFMKRYGWPRPPILIAVTLGEIVEKYLWISTNTWGWSMFLRPQFLVIGVFMLLIVAGSLRMRGHPSGVSEAPEQSGQAATATAKEISLAKGEIAGEIVLLVLVAAFLMYMLLDSLGLTGEGPAWTLGAALAPWIALAITTPFVIARLVTLVSLRHRVMTGARPPAATIMDVGFRIGDDPVGERRRFIRIAAAIIALFAGVWLIGFHIAVPIWVFSYVAMFSAGRKFRNATIMAVFFVALIFGLYDALLGVPWNTPLVFSVLS